MNLVSNEIDHYTKVSHLVLLSAKNDRGETRMGAPVALRARDDRNDIQKQTYQQLLSGAIVK